MKPNHERGLIALCLAIAAVAIWMQVGSSAADAELRAERIKAEILKACPQQPAPARDFRGGA